MLLVGLGGGKEASSRSLNPTQLQKLQSEVCVCVWLKSLPSSCAGPWRGLASSGLPVEALERGLDLEGPAKGLAMEPKEEPDWEAEQVPSRNKKKSWADLAAEEKKDPPKKDAHHGQKKEWWEED